MSLKTFNSINGYSVGANADIDIVDANGNVTANSLSVIADANLGNIANITISGGTSGQILTTDGSGNLSFSNQTLLTVASIDSSNVLSNSISNISTLSFDSDSGFDVIDVGNGVAKVAMNSTFKFWEVDGNAGLTATGLDTVNFITGNNINIIANANSTPQSLEFSVVPSGSNGQLQFNLANTSLGSSANLKFNSDSNVLIIDGGIDLIGELYLAGSASIRAAGNITVTAPTNFESNISFSSVDELNVSGNSNLGSVNNITITGGNNGFYLQTDGTGNLAWVAGGGSGNGETGGANTQVQFNDGGNFGGSSNFTFNKTNSNLFLNGNFTVTNGITSLGTVGNVKITGGSTGQFLSTDGNGNLTFTNVSGSINKPSILFNVTTDGNNQQFVDNNLTAFQNNNSYMSLYFNGVLMNTTEYVISGDTLTINRYLHTNDQLVVGSTTQTVAIPGSNTQVIFNNSGNLDAVPELTFDISSNTFSVGTGNITVGNINASSNIIANGANISGNTTVEDIVIIDTITYDKTYGCFHKMANITAPSANTVYNFDWYTDTTAHVGDQGVTVTSGQPTRINIDRAGEYTAFLEMQAQNDGNNERTAWIWLAKNGTDISETRIQVDLLKAAKQVISKLWLLDDIVANDYIEVRFAVDNVTNISLNYEPAQTTPFEMPAQPSATLTIVPVGA